jgi:hypothetical protein
MPTIMLSWFTAKHHFVVSTCSLVFFRFPRSASIIFHSTIAASSCKVSLCLVDHAQKFLQVLFDFVLCQPAHGQGEALLYISWETLRI